MVSIVDTIGITRKITRPRLEAFLRHYASADLTLDIGSGNSPYSNIFPNRKTVEVSPRPGHEPDYVADAHDLSVIQNESFDVVLCTEVLEHLHTPQKAIDEMYRVLKPGGKLILTTRFIFPLHETPVDYFRYTKYGLCHLLKKFDKTLIEEETDTVECLAVLYQRLGFQCDTLFLRPFKVFWFLLAKVTMFFSWIITRQYSDIHNSKEEGSILCSSYYVVCVK